MVVVPNLLANMVELIELQNMFNHGQGCYWDACVLCFKVQELIRIPSRYHISVLLACGGHGFGACGLTTCGDLLYLLKVVLG